MSEDFISSYLDYTSNTEVPTIFSRWAAIVGLGAYLGRQTWFPHGHFNVYPNIYCMLMGSPGTRKGTAIKLMKKLLDAAGYTTFSGEKTSKEKFLFDLAGESASNNPLDQNVWGLDLDSTSSDASLMFIAIDEINDFIGLNNIEFISLLGNLWDYSGNYAYRRQTGKSIIIPNPTISMLGGNTPVNFSLAFPSEILGQGFFSRLLLIHGEPNGKRITFPSPPNPDATAALLIQLQRIKQTCVGGVECTPDAVRVLDRIYNSDFGPADVRFTTYAGRRFTQLLKLATIISASNFSTRIDKSSCIAANTVLHYAEQFMPKALGEFGKAKHSSVNQKVLDLLANSESPRTLKEIWREVGNDLDKVADLANLLSALQYADKIIAIQSGFLLKRHTVLQYDEALLDYSILTSEERDYIA